MPTTAICDNGWQESSAKTRFLVIRRDNIGDLICTLPLLAALRRCAPAAAVDVLVNTYNRPLLDGNADVDTIYSYTKSKHRPDRSPIVSLTEQWRLLRTLRARRYDVVLVASGGLHRIETRLWLRFLGAAATVARETVGVGHEVDRVLSLARAIGLEPSAAAPTLHADPALVARAASALINPSKPIGLHISAREDENRWPWERFVELIRTGGARGLRFALFWSPGATDTPEHPGGDETAARILAATSGLPVTAHSTASLPALIAGLACCKRLVGSDGGHCHVAAAVGTPVLGLYCDHKVEQWRPWGASHTVLSARRVSDIAVEQVLTELLRDKD